MKKNSKSGNGDVQVLREQLARALADYDNLKKRYERQSDEIQVLAGAKIINRLLPVLDMLDRARDHTSDSGLYIISNEFRGVLKDEGLVEVVPEKGEKFDEEICEAVGQVNTKDAEMDGKIAGVTVNGWKYNDGPMLRHASVTVYKLAN